jgi:transposase
MVFVPVGLRAPTTPQGRPGPPPTWRGVAAAARAASGSVPHGHWKSTTFVAGLTSRGFIAPYVVDGAMNGVIFQARVAQMLAPELRPGDVVVMDNLTAHKAAAVRTAIAQRGAKLLHLPAYPPDLNPIEQAVSKLKALLRAAKERTVDPSWDRIGTLLERFSPAERQNSMANSGYPRSR